ncbi:UNVERIFIED_CONTAM: hypothetical protein FKN15_077894 [Acipenser sinensis]
MDGKVGSCGFNSRILPNVYPIRLVKVNEETMELIRGQDGLCVPCRPGVEGVSLYISVWISSLGVEGVSLYISVWISSLGVEGVEGKAGMVSIAVQDGLFDLAQFYTEIQKVLPPYARPVFLRISPEVATTGTFKIQKMRLQREGFDPRHSPDQIYFLNSRAGRYDPLDEGLHRAILEGRVSV